MSHNINFHKGRVSFAYNTKRGLPWHELGTGVDGLMTADECLNYANLHFTVASVDVRTPSGNIVPNTKAIVRTDNGIVLTGNGKLVTPQYKVYQNHEAFDFIDDIVIDSKAVYETAGALGNGATVFITAALDKIKIVNDEVAPYLFFALFHDGSGAVKIGITNIRIVCNNTLNQALHTKHSISVMHKGNMKEKIYLASQKLGLLSESINMRNESYSHLARARMSDATMERFVAKMFLSKEEHNRYITNGYNFNGIELSSRKVNTMQSVISYYHNDSTLNTVRGNAWGAFNAITGYMSNLKSYSSQEIQFNNLVGGKDSKLELAYEDLLIYANKVL